MQSNQYVGNYLERFLGSSRLSLSQAANKMGVSKAYLSQIKNGIRKPSMDKALNILKFCGAKEQEIKEYCEQSHKQQSDKYANIMDKNESKLRLQKLSEEASFKLAKDIDLLNAFEDIYCEGNDGIEKGLLIENYGLSIVGKLEFLIDRGVVTRQDNRFFVDSSKFHGFTARSSFRFLKTIIENEEDHFDINTNLGKSRFDWDDVNDEGYKEMLKTIQESQAKLKQIANQHSLSVKDGGKRIAYFNMMSCIHKMVIVCLLFIGLNNSSLFAGAGGGGHDPVGGGNMRWMSKPNQIHKGDYKPIIHATKTIQQLSIKTEIKRFKEFDNKFNIKSKKDNRII